MRVKDKHVLKANFWDVDPFILDTERHSKYIIERVLEHGDDRAVKWLFRKFSREEISAVVRESRRLSPKSRTFWSIKLNLWPGLKRSVPKPSAIWKY